MAIIQDWGVGLQPLYDQYDATQLALDEATESGLLDRPVELKVVEVEGLPYARATTILEAVDASRPRVSTHRDHRSAHVRERAR